MKMETSHVSARAGSVSRKAPLGQKAVVIKTEPVEESTEKKPDFRQNAAVDRMMKGLLGIKAITVPGQKVAAEHTPDTHLPSLRHYIFQRVMAFYHEQALAVEARWGVHAVSRDDQARLIDVAPADLEITGVADIITVVAIARVTKCAPRVAFAADPDQKFRSTANTLRSSPTESKTGSKEGTNELYVNVNTKKTPSSYEKARQKIAQVCEELAWKRVCNTLISKNIPLALLMDLNNETVTVEKMKEKDLAAVKAFLRDEFKQKKLPNETVVTLAKSYVQQTVKPLQDAEEKRVLSDYFRTMLRLIKGTLPNKPSTVLADSLLIETSLIWSVAEAFRAPVALPYLLMSLMNLKHGDVNPDTAIQSSLPTIADPVYAPGCEGASVELQQLFKFEEPAFHRFHRYFEAILRRFLIHYGFDVTHNHITPPDGFEETASQFVDRKLGLPQAA